jgi:nitrate reductase NapAB chaperone NapD
MSVLGVVARVRPEDLPEILDRLAGLPGVELAGNPGDGRLVLVIEDSPGCTAAARLGELAEWPPMLSTSLVYEYSGPDSPAAHAPVTHWRSPLRDIAADRPAAA